MVSNDLLNLPGFKYLYHVENEHDIAIYVDITTEPEKCPGCGSDVALLERWGHTDLTYVYDTPQRGRRVRLYYILQRYKCKTIRDGVRCVTTKQPLLGIDESKRMTQRLKQYILYRAFQPATTNLSIKEETGVPDSTIRNIIADRIEQWELTEKPQTPEWLAIDEVYLGKEGKLCVLSAPAEKRYVDILENDDQKTVLRALIQLPNRERIKIVSMDICGKYHKVVKMALPNANIIFDRRHVQEMARRALVAFLGHLEETRGARWCRRNMHNRALLYKRYHQLDDGKSGEKKGKSEQDYFNQWMEQVPEIGEAYWLKEEFCNLFEMASREEAERQYDEWEKKVLEGAPFFHSVAHVVKAWREQIFKYIEYREYYSLKVTNGFAEALNGQIKRRYRLCNGLSFWMLRGKLLLGGLVKHRPRYFLDEEKLKTGRRGVKRNKDAEPGPEAHSSRLRHAHEQQDETIGLIQSPMENSEYAVRFENLQGWLSFDEEETPLIKTRERRKRKRKAGLPTTKGSRKQVQPSFKQITMF